MACEKQERRVDPAPQGGAVAERRGVHVEDGEETPTRIRAISNAESVEKGILNTIGQQGST